MQLGLINTAVEGLGTAPWLPDTERRFGAGHRSPRSVRRVRPIMAVNTAKLGVFITEL